MEKKDSVQHIVIKIVSTLEIATFWIWRRSQKLVFRREHNEKWTNSTEIGIWKGANGNKMLGSERVDGWTAFANRLKPSERWS